MQLNDGIKTYLREISTHRLLSREEEHELFARLRSGDESARNEIVRCNLRLVVRIAQRFRNKGLSMEDLIQEGNIGLLDVIDRFDHDLGFRFSTYAAFWIRQSIQVALRRHGSLIRIPVRKARLLGRMSELVQEWHSVHGRAPSTAELAERLEVPVEQVENLACLSRTALSIDVPFDDDGVTLQDRLADESLVPASESVMQSELERRVHGALRQLSDREHSILAMRFGLHGHTARSLRNVSKRVGLSQEGVRRVEQRALAKLGRQRFKSQLAGLL